MSHKRRIFTVMVLVLVLAAAFPRRAGAQRLAVKTNVLSWAALAPDLGVEIVTGEHTSVALSAFGTYRPFGLDWELLVVQPEFRYWFNGRPLTREYVGVTAFGTRYALTLPAGAEDRYNVFQGDGVAAGLSGGYVFNMGRRWNFELSGGTGVLVFRQKQYFSEDNYEQYFVEEISKPNTWGIKLFPVKLAATFIYIIR